MATDDNEKSGKKQAASSRKTPELPSRVERALERAREAAKADRQRKAGRWLAVLPASVALILLLLLMPRSTTPELVPLPRTDQRVIADIARADDARAAAAERDRLPSDVLVVGTALRALNGADARGADELAMIDARRQLDGSLRDLARREGVTADLITLRALQTRHFLDTLVHWEKTGETSEDFIDLAASFVQRAMDAGWVENGKVLPSETERRVMFKTVWNVLTGVDTHPAFALTLDEERALYSFYIQHPRLPEVRRLTLETELRAATTRDACERANVEHHRQTEFWRADKIKKLGQVDSAYPTEYALGVVYYRAGRFDLAADNFSAFIGAHPDGPYALRARNHLKAALSAHTPL